MDDKYEKRLLSNEEKQHIGSLAYAAYKLAETPLDRVEWQTAEIKAVTGFPGMGKCSAKYYDKLCKHFQALIDFPHNRPSTAKKSHKRKPRAIRELSDRKMNCVRAAIRYAYTQVCPDTSLQDWQRSEIIKVTGQASLSRCPSTSYRDLMRHFNTLEQENTPLGTVSKREQEIRTIASAVEDDAQRVGTKLTRTERARILVAAFDAYQAAQPNMDRGKWVSAELRKVVGFNSVYLCCTDNYSTLLEHFRNIGRISKPPGKTRSDVEERLEETYQYYQ